jgi:4-amino-4-deoxy-L-arabinose transferase-like glycosyltransferase
VGAGGYPAPVSVHEVAHLREQRAGLGKMAAVGAGVMCAGAVLRGLILTSRFGIADSDEAVSGLVTRHLLDDPTSLPVFIWDSNYAGTLEAVITAIPFALFGSSILSLKLTIVALHVGACVLLWRVGRRVVDERAGVVAGCALWVWPGVFVWWSTKARDYEVLLVCGLLVLLFALRIIEDPQDKRNWLALGAAAGVGWWTNPQIAYLAVPAGLWILMDRPRSIVRAPIALAGFVIGAAPWIIWNLRNGWGSLDSTFEATEGYLDHLSRFWAEGVPVMLGLRTPYLLRSTVRVWEVVLVVLLLGAGLSLLFVRRPGARYLGVALVAYPLIHALTPVANFTGEARYLYLYGPIVALVVARAVWHPAAVGLAFAVMLAFTVRSLTTIPAGAAGTASNLPVPAHMGSLIRTLEKEKIDAAIADYWIAYRLTFESRERIIGTGVPSHRHKPFQDFVYNRSRSAWVYVDNSTADQNFTASLRGQGIPFRTIKTGGFAVHIPDRPVHPREVVYQ